jgi:uncharacterized lipoprotein YbaY
MTQVVKSLPGKFKLQYRPKKLTANLSIEASFRIKKKNEATFLMQNKKLLK